MVINGKYKINSLLLNNKLMHYYIFQLAKSNQIHFKRDTINTQYEVIYHKIIIRIYLIFETIKMPFRVL